MEARRWKINHLMDWVEVLRKPGRVGLEKFMGHLIPNCKGIVFGLGEDEKLIPFLFDVHFFLYDK